MGSLLTLPVSSDNLESNLTKVLISFYSNIGQALLVYWYGILFLYRLLESHSDSRGGYPTALD